MRIHAFSMVVLLFSTLLISGCSTVPGLSEATGVNGTDESTGQPKSSILISDIVKRTKCEIADSLGDRITDSRFLWMANWTVKVDLLLQANDVVSFTPGFSYTNFYNNAYNFAAGPTAYRGTTIAGVNQSYAAGAGATYGEQALRAETVTFPCPFKSSGLGENRTTGRARVSAHLPFVSAPQAPA